MKNRQRQRGMMGTAMVVLAVAGVLVYVGSTVLSQMGRTTINRAAIQTAQKEVSQLAIDLSIESVRREITYTNTDDNQTIRLKIYAPRTNTPVSSTVSIDISPQDPWGNNYIKHVPALPTGGTITETTPQAVKTEYDNIKNRLGMVIYSKGPNGKLDVRWEDIDHATPNRIGNFGDDIFEILTYGDIERIYLSTNTERSGADSIPQSKALRFNHDEEVWNNNVRIDSKIFRTTSDTLTRTNMSHKDSKIIQDLTIDATDSTIWNTRADKAPGIICNAGETPKLNGETWACEPLIGSGENMECVQVSLENGNQSSLKLTYRSPTALVRDVKIDSVVTYFNNKKQSTPNSSVSAIKVANVTFNETNDLVGFTAKAPWRAMSCSRAQDGVDGSGVYLIDNSCLDWESNSGLITGTLCRPAASFVTQPPQNCQDKALKWDGSQFTC